MNLKQQISDFMLRHEDHPDKAMSHEEWADWVADDLIAEFFRGRKARSAGGIGD
jgi:hypothetical protein